MKNRLSKTSKIGQSTIVGGVILTLKPANMVFVGAHIIRELVALQEQNSIWAKEMHDFLFELYKKSEKATIILADKPRWMQQFQAIYHNVDVEEPLPIKKVRGKPKNSKGRNLLKRLIKHQNAILAFELAIPFSNNLAERDIRCVKVKP